MKFEFSLQIFEKYTSIKLHENPLNGNRVAAAGWMHGETERRRDGQRNGQKNGRTEGQTDGQTHE